MHDVPKQAYWQVVEHCYLCDMCYMTKCPYVPPHEWNVDFPHLMLRAKVKAFEDGKASFRDKVLSSTDTVGSLAGIPVVAEAVNAVNASKLGPQAAREDARRRPGSARAEVSLAQRALAAQGSRRPRRRGQARRRNARPRRRVRDLLRQSQSPGPRRGPRRRARAQRHRRRARRQRALLRHAEARARRPEVDREAQGGQHRRARRAMPATAGISRPSCRRAC